MTSMMLSYISTMSLLINKGQLSSWNTADFIHYLTSDLGWHSVIFIYDHSTHHLFRNVDVRQQHYNIDQKDIVSILESIHTSMSPHLNIIIAVNSTRILSVISTMDWFDIVSNTTTIYRHHSRILILMNKASYDFNVQHLENVAVCFLGDKIDVNGTQRWNIMCSTLEIHPHRRVFVPVKTAVIPTTCFQTSLFPNIFKGYNNRLLKVSSLESPPYVMKQNISSNGILYTGYLFDIWNTIADKLNISYEVVEPSDMSWGSYTTGKWNGIVEQLINKEVDIAITDMTVTAERSEVIDFIFPSVMVDTTDILYRRKKSHLQTFSRLLGPLSSPVYLLLLCVWVVTAVLYVVLEAGQRERKIYPKSRGQGQRAFDNGLVFSVRLTGHSIWSFMATILKQGFPMTPSSPGGSVLLSSWLFLVLLITSVYCANLIAALSSQSGLSRLSSIDELVDSDYTTGMFTSGLPYETMQRTKRPELKRLFAKMLKASKSDLGIFKNDMEAHISRVKHGGHSVIVYKSTAAKYINDDCQLAFLKESVTMSEEYISFALPKGSPLKHDLEKVLWSLSDAGILEILWSNRTKSSNRTCDVSRDLIVISLSEVSGGLLLVCSGLGLACAVLAVEIFQRRADKTRTA